MTDVAVFGATGAGVMAAVAAAESGAATVLVEPGRHVGGMVSGGLCWTDVGDPGVVGGLARRFYAAVADHYGVPLWGVKGPEPHVAERILTAMLEDAGVEIALERDDVPDAAVHVDASYEGDVMASRGVPYAVGRESRERYGERWAGRQPAYRPGKHNFGVVLSPFAEDDTLLAHVREPELDEHGWPDEALGEGDGGLQAYGLRLCLTDRPDNRLPWEEPADYEPDEFELLRRYLVAVDVEAHDLMGLVPDLLPNGKCDVNSIGPFSLNLLDGSNRDYPDGDAEARTRVCEHHLSYARALLWFLATDDAVPARIRHEIGRWGRCADEFEDTDGWPHQLYVRDGRRLVGEYVLREGDLLGARAQEDVVAFGSYNIDIRENERTWRYLPEYERTPAVFNEGYLSVAVPPYPIPYRSLLPQREDAENLLVPVCLSASHVAFGSVRMEPTLMLLGHAAGAAAAQAARRGIAVQDVDVALLQDSLRDAGQVLAPVNDTANPIAFMTANYVARETGWAMHGWGHGDRATNDAFRPLETYGERLDELLVGIRELGFDTIDLWGAHLNPDWASAEHVAIARELLERRGLGLATYATWLDAGTVERACELATAMGTNIIGAGASGDLPALVPALREHGITLAIENHPEKTPADVLAKIELGEGTLAATVDTGWWATQGYDPVRAIEELGDHIRHVHLKDVRAEGEPHDTCRWGMGIVDVGACVDRLRAAGYAGPLTVEHEPEDHDPSEECREMLGELREWLK